MRQRENWLKYALEHDWHGGALRLRTANGGLLHCRICGIEMDPSGIVLRFDRMAELKDESEKQTWVQTSDDNRLYDLYLPACNYILRSEDSGVARFQYKNGYPCDLEGLYPFTALPIDSPIFE